MRQTPGITYGPGVKPFGGFHIVKHRVHRRPDVAHPMRPTHRTLDRAPQRAHVPALLNETRRAAGEAAGIRRQRRHFDKQRSPANFFKQALVIGREKALAAPPMERGHCLMMGEVKHEVPEATSRSKRGGQQARTPESQPLASKAQKPYPT